MRIFLFAVVGMVLVPNAYAQCPAGSACELFSTFANSVGAAGVPAATDRIPYVQGAATKYTGSVTVPNNIALALRPTSSSPSVVRQGVAVPGDAAALLFNAETGTCASNSRINDGGSCVDNSSGNSWFASLPLALDYREWGFTGTPTFYVNNLTGNPSASNFCLNVGTPCASIGQALAAALRFDLANTGAIISIAATGTTYTESNAINGPGRGQSSNANFVGATSLPLITFVGTGGTAVLNNNASFCYTLLVNNGAMAALGGNLQIEATNNSCASSLYSQFGGTWFNKAANDILGPATANLWIGEENGYFINTPACNSACDGYLQFGGSATTGLNATAGSGFESDSQIAITGTPTFTRLLWASVGGSYIKSFAVDGIFSGNIASGNRFLSTLNSTIFLNFAPTWPAGSTPGIVDYNGTYFDPTVAGTAPCIGGSVGCVAPNSPTGLGGGTVNFTGSGAGVKGGAFEFTAGPSAVSVGTLQIGMPYFLMNGLCQWQLVSGSNPLPNGFLTIPSGFAAAGLSFTVTWNLLSAPFISGDTFFLQYNCNSQD